MTIQNVYDKETTALLCVDFYNDFLSEGGKLWPLAEKTATENNLLNNLRDIVKTSREAGLKVYHVPHRRYEKGDYEDWKHASPYTLAGAAKEIFAKDTWGGTWHDDFPIQPEDIVVKEHWGSSGFQNTDLEHMLKVHGKTKIICVGMFANTCLEATGRYGMELGYHVTMVRDGTAAASDEAMHTAININAPTYAHQILTTAELVEAIKASNA